MLRNVGWGCGALVLALVGGTALAVGVLWPAMSEDATARTVEILASDRGSWSASDPGCSGDLGNAGGRPTMICLDGTRRALEGSEWSPVPGRWAWPSGAILPNGWEVQIDSDSDGAHPTLYVTREGTRRALARDLDVDPYGQNRYAWLAGERILVAAERPAEIEADGTRRYTGPALFVVPAEGGAPVAVPDPPAALAGEISRVVVDGLVGAGPDAALVFVVQADEVGAVEPSTGAALLVELSTGRWSRVRRPRIGGGPTFVERAGDVIALGAYGDGSARLARFDLATRRWAPLPPLTERRFGPALAQTADGRVVVGGGTISPPRRALSPEDAGVKGLAIALVIALAGLGAFCVKRWRAPLWSMIAGALVALVWGGFWIVVIPNLSFGHGRPSRRGGRPRLARLRVRGRARASCDAGPIARLRLARAWAADARLEQASVTAFEELGDDLRHVGAPDALVAWAARAADEERAHARLCAGLASRAAGAELEAVALAPAPRDAGETRAATLGRLAREALADGCAGEGIAAEAARAAGREASEPEARAALARIAIDEAGHAELAWAVLAFCLREGGEPVARAAREALRELEAAAPWRGLPARRANDALRDHGRLVERDPGALDRGVRARVIARARRCLARDAEHRAA